MFCWVRKPQGKIKKLKKRKKRTIKEIRRKKSKKRLVKGLSKEKKELTAVYVFMFVRNITAIY